MNRLNIPALLKQSLKIALTLCLLHLSFFSISQDSKIDSTHVDFQTGFSFEVHNTKNFGMSFGGVLGKNIGNKMTSNYFTGLYVDVLFVDQPIVAPRLKITLNYLGFFGANLCFANYYRDGLNDFRISPEINFSLFGRASVFVGYNVRVSKHKFSEIGDYKLGLNINLTH